jgi:N-acyl-D-amino-acid deacylase
MYDLTVRGGRVLDGRGSVPHTTDVAVSGDRVVVVGDLPPGEAAATVLDAHGLVVCPGFVNPLSHSYFSVLEDGTSLGELVQGVTTQIFGEGESMGPVPAEGRAALEREAATYGVEVTWRRLSEYLDSVERAGCTQNVASLVGAETMRVHGVGYDDRPATDAELDRMRALVAEVTQITEKVDNALKVTEDVYLARVYSSALELFRVRYWAGSIDRKLSLMRDAYTALYDESVATRMEWMEAIIVLLIVIEVVLAFVGWGGE